MELAATPPVSPALGFTGIDSTLGSVRNLAPLYMQLWVH
jgi:hypothetical protein